MTPEDSFIELLDRVAASQGASALVSAHELAQWPGEAVAAMKAQKLITKARPAASVVCPGCEEECLMPVHTIPVPSGDPALFIVCDKRSDINRVPIPISRLIQWRCTAEAVCGFVATCLGLRLRGKEAVSASRWHIGMITCGKRRQMLRLQSDGELVLIAGSSTVALIEVIAYDEGTYSIDESMIRRLVNSTPSAEGAHATATEDPCRVFRAMENLDAAELAIAFVGDKSETGLGASNMLEIAARGETRRVALAELDLVDRRQGSTNSQGVILLGMALKRNLGHTGANAKKMTRLRKVFRARLGIKGDPFDPYRKGAGWDPRFKLVDKRGAADERARRDAERRTVSLTQLSERDERLAALSASEPLFDTDSDDADDWLKTHYPNGST